MMNLRRFTANKICRRWWISADTQQITICRRWWISAGTQKITGFSRDESPWSIGDWWLWDSMSAGFHGFSCTEFFLFCSPLSFWWSPYSPPPLLCSALLLHTQNENSHLAEQRITKLHRKPGPFHIHILSIYQYTVNLSPSIYTIYIYSTLYIIYRELCGARQLQLRRVHYPNQIQKIFLFHNQSTMQSFVIRESRKF